MSHKIALPIAELKPALTGLGKIVSKRCTLPVLNHIKIERTSDGWIALTVTDLDHFATVRMEQPSDGEALSLLVPYDELQKVTKNCQKSDSVLVSGNGKDSVAIEYAIGNQVAEVKAASLPVEEFPEIPRIKGDSTPLNDSLRSSIHEALECASIDETRQILNGAFIDVSKPEGHYVVGTDGRHLYASNSFTLALKEPVIIPAQKFLGWKEFNNDGEWQLKLGEKPDKDTPAPVQITTRRWRFITPQHAGVYPNWRQVIVTDFNTSIEFDPATLETVIRVVERMPEHDAINHTIGIEVRGQRVNILCKADKKQPKWTAVEVSNVTTRGKDVAIYLNRHLLVKALGFGLNQLDITDPISPVRFSHEGRQIIVMPIRTTDSPKAAPPVPESTSQPAAPPQAANEERSTTMPRTPASNGNGHNGNEAKSSIQSAIEQIETIKESLKTAKDGLNALADTLKQVQRDHKTSEREVQSVRTTLEKLQSVKL